jgi:signal transduction histidine kinase
MLNGTMLQEIIVAHRGKIISLTRAKIAERLAPVPTERELASGVPLFLDQLFESLQLAPLSMTETIERSAAVHAASLLALGYTVAQVVCDYGDICQAITELADETSASITTSEFNILNRCLDEAIAAAVTEYARLRERSMIADKTERSGVFAHELRNRISAAQVAFHAIQSGRAPVGGSVAGVVARNLKRMTALVNQSLVEVRLESGNTNLQRVHLYQLIDEAEVDGTLEATTYGASFCVAPVERGIDLDVDPQILAAAVANLLQNAFKFSRGGGRVLLETKVVGARVEIAIEDECGGLPAGKAEELFGAFQQHGTNRSGLGLGLFISRKGVEACGGGIRVRDIPGSGCVFTIDLPLSPPAT